MTTCSVRPSVLSDAYVHAYQTTAEKFVIAMENKARPGYFTEKIVNAALANAIPVYWGAPDMGDYMKSLETVGRSRRKLEPSHPRPDAIPYRKRPSDVQLETALMKDKLLGLGYHNHESRVRLDTNWHEGTASAMVVAKHYIGRDNQGKKTVLTSNY